jgi:formate dehydrogenase subunit gamma
MRTNFAVRAMLALLLAVLLPAAWAGVPNKKAVPAYAEEQTMLQVEADSVTPEPGFTSPASGRVHVDRHYLGQYGSTEANVIVQRGGNTWRWLRNGPLATISGTLILVVPLIILLFYQAVRSGLPVLPESGRRIVRFTAWERTIHWATAISFVILAVTGLIIMFGKVVLLPWMGHNFYSGVAYVSKYVHNFIGPVFVLCTVLMFFTFVRRNKFDRRDWYWVKRGGGMISHQHIPTGYFNAGEKAWFWFGVTLLGLLMSATGLFLDFVTFGQTRYLLQVADYLHITGATLFIVAAMGHIYMGTVGTPGAYEAMRHGTVDEEWARAHHEIWYDDVKGGRAPSAPGAHPDSRPPGSRPGPAH